MNLKMIPEPEVRTFGTFNRRVSHLAFTDYDGIAFAADGMIGVYEALDDTNFQVVENGRMVSALAVGPNNIYVGRANPNNLTRFNVLTHEIQRSNIGTDTPVTAIALCPSNEELFAYGTKGGIVFVRGGAEHFAWQHAIGHGGVITNLRISVDGKKIFSASKDGKIKSRGLELRSQYAWIEERIEGKWQCLAASPNNKWLAATTAEGEVHLIRPRQHLNSNVSASIGRSLSIPVCVEFSPDSQYLIQTGRFFSLNAHASQLRISKIGTDAQVQVVKDIPFLCNPTALAISNTGQYLAVNVSLGDNPNAITVFDFGADNLGMGLGALVKPKNPFDIPFDEWK